MDLGNGVEINFEKLSDVQLQAVRVEVHAAGEARGLWVPESVGQLATAWTATVETIRADLLSTVEEGSDLFNGAVEVINSNRKKRDQIPVTQPGEYRERAEDWLTDKRIVAASQLPTASDRPRLVIPRLNRPVTTEEVVDNWKTATNGRLWRWHDRMEFLSNWTADELSGYDPEQTDEDRLEVIATAYDEEREGTVKEQKTALEVLQIESPELGVATIFDGAVLALRYMNDNQRDWRDSYVRGITLEPAKVGGFGCVPSAGVGGGGNAGVRASGVDGDGAARLRVR